VNDFGIGYINQKTFKSGFRPKIIQSGNNISSLITGYGTGAYSTTSNSNLSVDYLNFEIPGKKENTTLIDIDSLLNLKAIDTTRLRRR